MLFGIFAINHRIWYIYPSLIILGALNDDGDDGDANYHVVRPKSKIFIRCHHQHHHDHQK